MPLIFINHITTSTIQTHRDWLFIFGDNEQRRGRGGQAAVCRGHLNALGVATKRSPASSPDAYWSDADFARVTPIIDADLMPAFEHIRRGGTVVCPTAGIGTGLADLPNRAPAIFQYIRSRIIELKRAGQACSPARPSSKVRPSQKPPQRTL
jgi:hypothetical protein